MLYVCLFFFLLHERIDGCSGKTPGKIVEKFLVLIHSTVTASAVPVVKRSGGHDRAHSVAPDTRALEPDGRLSRCAGRSWCDLEQRRRSAPTVVAFRSRLPQLSRNPIGRRAVVVFRRSYRQSSALLYTSRAALCNNDNMCNGITTNLGELTL